MCASVHQVFLIFLNPAPPCSGPTLTSGLVNSTVASAKLSLPSVGGPWSRYECSACVSGANPANCKTAPQCAAGAAITTCLLPGLTPSTKYEVVCVAAKADGTKSPPSNAVLITTEAAP